MTDDLSLFGDDPEPDRAPDTVAAPQALADWQVTLLRTALDGCGVDNMTARQHLVEEIVGRPVDSLRGLTTTEARSLLEQLHARAASSSGQHQGSSWDAREEDTWTDRL